MPKEQYKDIFQYIFQHGRHLDLHYVIQVAC